MQGFSILDNIIYGGGSTNSTTSQQIQWCNISHNLFFGDYSEEGIIGNLSSGTNNIYGFANSPNFVDDTNFPTPMNDYNYTNNPQGPLPNLNLQETSPAVGSGFEGFDMGIYAGEFPWRDNPAGGARTYFPGVAMPEIYDMQVEGLTTPEGSFEIQIKARSAN